MGLWLIASSEGFAELPGNDMRVVIRILEGMERGEVFHDLALPCTVGREEENAVQLNDDRISRFHCKLQEDSGRVILTDLDSTNGTRVNGRAVQMHVLQPGDLIMVGRCVLLYGDVPPPAVTLATSNQGAPETRIGLTDPGDSGDLEFSIATDFEMGRKPMFPHGRPELPLDLKGLQRVQLNDLIAWIHDELGSVLQNASEQSSAMTGLRQLLIPWAQRERLIELEASLAEILRRLSSNDNV